MTACIGRREFILLLGGAAAAWPLVARAQQPAMPVVGFLDPTSRDANADRLRGFRQGLKDTGYIDGENVVIEYRWGEIKLIGCRSWRPIWFAASHGDRHVRKWRVGGQGGNRYDPHRFHFRRRPGQVGLVASLARPDANVTGINFFSGELSAKRLELLRELVPGSTRVAVLVNPTDPTVETMLKDVESASRAIGLQIRVLNVSTSSEIDEAFATLVREQPDALFVGADPFFASRRVQLVHLATPTKSLRHMRDVNFPKPAG